MSASATRRGISEKAQLFTGDLVFGLFIFTITLAILLQLWQTTYDNLWSNENDYEMNWLADTVANQLVRTSGDPYEWTSSNVVAVGLAKVQAGGVVESRVIDPDKLMFFIDMFNKNYTSARNILLGSGQFDVYFELSCLNSTDLHCLQGLPLHSFSGQPECENLNGTIHVHDFDPNNKFTDVYKWIEAEDLWGNPDPTWCRKQCSGGNMSNIGLLAGDTTKKISTPPGNYQIWSRGVDLDSPAQLLVDGVPYNISTTLAKDFVGWTWLGNQTLTQETTLAIANQASGDNLDALLLTTDNFYDPRSMNLETLGDPNLYGTCIFGNTNEGSDIIARTRTAIIGMPLNSAVLFEGMQPIVGDTIQIRVVVWGGEAMPLRNKTALTTTTTTTLPPLPLTCDGSPSYGCVSPNAPVIKLEHLSIWDNNGFNTTTLKCGTTYPMTVSWFGRHAVDPNYFGFFIENSSNRLYACQSNASSETDDINYNYDMNCSFTMPSGLTLPDGYYNLVITGEDFEGFCNPGDFNADDQKNFRVKLQDCITYNPHQCTPLPFSAKPGCLGLKRTVNGIYKVDVAGDKLICNTDVPVNISWGGTHGDNNHVQWTYLIRGAAGYTCVGVCRSSVNSPEPSSQYYDLECGLMLNSSDCSGKHYSFPDNIYELDVVAESSADAYCNDPDSSKAEAVFRRQVNISSC